MSKHALIAMLLGNILFVVGWVYGPYRVSGNGEAVEEAHAALEDVNYGKCDLAITVRDRAVEISATSQTKSAAQTVPSIGVGIRKYRDSVETSARNVLREAGCR